MTIYLRSSLKISLSIDPQESNLRCEYGKKEVFSDRKKSMYSEALMCSHLRPSDPMSFVSGLLVPGRAARK